MRRLVAAACLSLAVIQTGCSPSPDANSNRQAPIAIVDGPAPGATAVNDAAPAMDSLDPSDADNAQPDEEVVESNRL
jgi:hypothetical protein